MPTNNKPIPNPLSKRQGTILHLLAEGMSQKEIAKDLNISIYTVRMHINVLRGKLNHFSNVRMPSVAEMIKIGFENKWI